MKINVYNIHYTALHVLKMNFLKQKVFRVDDQKNFVLFKVTQSLYNVKIQYLNNLQFIALNFNNAKFVII